MARRYRRFTLIARRPDGSVAAGKAINIYRVSDGSLATLYKGDNLSGGLESNPVFSGDDGKVTFFAGDNKDEYSFIPEEGGIGVAIEGTADTLENHRVTGEHADGVIGMEQLTQEVQDAIGGGGSPDVAAHEVLVRGTHGVPNVLGTEGFAYSETGGATNSPKFDAIVYSSLMPDGTIDATFHGARVIETSSFTNLENAINAASSGDTILITQGTHVPSEVTISKGITIKGMGPNCILAPAGFFEITTTEAVNFEDLTIDTAALSGGIEFRETSDDVMRFSRCRILNTSAGSTNPRINVIGLARSFSIQDCVFNGAGSCLTVSGGVGSNGLLTLHGNRFFRNNSGDCVTLGGAYTAASIMGNYFERNVQCNLANTFWHGNVIENDIDFTAPAAGSLFPTNGNIVLGTVTGLEWAGQYAGWQHISANWIDLDNTGPTFQDRFFTFGDTGFGTDVNHGLDTRELEVMILVSDNSAGAGRVWPIFPGSSPAANDDVVPGVNHFGVQIIDDNNLRVVGYAGDVQNGSGTTTGSTSHIFTAVDASALQAVDSKTYNYAAAGGIQLNQAWAKVFVRRAQK